VTRSQHSLRSIFFAILITILGANYASAAAIVNADFSAGLTGWTVSDPTFVSTTSGAAILSEPNNALVVTLEQSFTIPIGSLYIELVLSDLVTEQDVGGLLNASDVSLVPTVAGTTNFYIRDLCAGVTEGEAASGVTLTPSPSSLPLSICLDISALTATTPVEAKILFELVAGGPLTDGASYTPLTALLCSTTEAEEVAVAEPMSSLSLVRSLFGALARCVGRYSPAAVEPVERVSRRL